MGGWVRGWAVLGCWRWPAGQREERETAACFRVKTAEKAGAWRRGEMGSIFTALKSASAPRSSPRGRWRGWRTKRRLQPSRSGAMCAGR